MSHPHSAALLLLFLVACAPQPAQPVISAPPAIPAPPVSSASPVTSAPPVPTVAPAPAAPSPFVAVAPVGGNFVGVGVFELEGALLAGSDQGLIELEGGVARPRPDLAVGLPIDSCHGVTGVVGRFPDAAFAFVSWSSRECGSIFGAHRVFRWNGRAWSAFAFAGKSPIEHVACAGVTLSQGPGVAVCDHNAVGDTCAGGYTILPSVARAAPSPFGRHLDVKLETPSFRFTRSGAAVALGTAAAGAAIERWRPGQSRGVVTPLPVPAGCEPAGIHVRDPRDIVVAAACPGADGRVLRFDGRAWSQIPTPGPAQITALTGEADGTLWLAVARDREAAVLRRSPEGEWANAPLPAEGSDSPTRLVVRGEDVWAVASRILHAPRSAFGVGDR